MGFIRVHQMLKAFRNMGIHDFSERESAPVMTRLAPDRSWSRGAIAHRGLGTTRGKYQAPDVLAAPKESVPPGGTGLPLLAGVAAWTSAPIKEVPENSWKAFLRRPQPDAAARWRVEMRAEPA